MNVEIAPLTEAPFVKLPGDWETNESYKETGASIFHLAGALDEYYPPSRVENYATQLRQRADDFEFRSYDAGHEISEPMRKDLREWLIAKCGPWNSPDQSGV